MYFDLVNYVFNGLLQSQKSFYFIFVVLLIGLLRCGKSCRLRWINYLKSDLKRGNITSDEEAIIIKLRATLGNRFVRFH